MSHVATVVVLVLHGVSAMLLIGAVTHQALAVWAPVHGVHEGWWSALRGVHAQRYATAVVVLFLATMALGTIDYVPFRIGAREQYLDVHVHWATGLFEIKEHTAALVLALLPAYWAVWRNVEAVRGRRSITTLLAFGAWWNFVVGHIVNNVRGL